MNGRHDSPDERDERLNRNLDQLLEELRVALPGVQVLFAFLLAVPFTTRFARVDGAERGIYFATLGFAALASVQLMAPSIHHRILFRRGAKSHLVQIGNRLAIGGLTCLAVSMTGALVLIGRYLYGSLAGVVVGVAAGIAYVIVWYAVPLRHLRKIEQTQRSSVTR